jgi:hypothetical protein
LEIIKESLCDNVLEATALHYILIVPAIWSETANQKTMLCGERAGMGAGLRLISEPEAPIMHASDQELSELEVGDTFVVCDAGGGTVDLISYIVEQLNPFLQISEATPGTGYACGSNFLNRIFSRMLQEKFGHLLGWADDTLEDALKYFEKDVKRRFDGDNENFLVPLPGLRDSREAGIKRGKWIMSGSVVRTVFEPIIAIIIEYVQMQTTMHRRKER